MNSKIAFRDGDYVVYPAHGVGEIVQTEQHQFSGVSIAVYVIKFAVDNMMIRLPVVKAKSSGLRPLTDCSAIEAILDELAKPLKSEKMIWKRKAAEYEKKLNSGDLSSIAEVLRDLNADGYDNLSYAKKEYYETALKRISEEVAVVKNMDSVEANALVKAKLQAVALHA